MMRMTSRPYRATLAVGLATMALLLAGTTTWRAQTLKIDYGWDRGPGFDFGKKLPPIPWNGARRTKPLAHNMRQVGWTDVNGHPDAEQITGQVINGRDYIFFGHYWSQGVSIIDVTDPAKPEVVGYIPTRDAYTKSTKVQVVGTTLMVPIRPLYELDKRPPLPERLGVNFYDVSNPRAPKHLSFFQTATSGEPGITDGVHYSQFTGRYAYLSAPANGYHGLIYMIVDVSDPLHPKEAGRWAAPGQHVGAGEQYVKGETATLHGAQANRDDTLGFFSVLEDPPGGLMILDIKDKAHPRLLSRTDMSPPMMEPYFGVHNVVLMESRKILVCMNEGVGNAMSRPQMTGWVMDYSNPSKPVILSVLPIPQGFDLREPARFGPHNAHENQPNGLIDDYMLYISWFHGGVRIFNLSDPKHPTEAGSFAPPDPPYRMDPRTWSGKPGDPDGSELSSLNHVYVDKRGYVYASGYNDGLYILEYTGPRPQGSLTALTDARRTRDTQGTR
jgi:hypothetical protein